MLEEEYERDRRRLPRHLRPAPAPEPAFAFEIRAVEDTDVGEVRDIYNHYVRNSAVTFDDAAWSVAKWREKIAYLRARGLPFLVAPSPSGQVLGFAFVQPMSAKAAYRASVETSIYLGQAATGKGLGRALLTELVAACERAGIREMVAVVSDKGAEASIALHESLGFTEVGRRGRVGFTFGRWLGVVYLRRSLRPTRRRRS